MFYAGIALYCAGSILLVLSIINFAFPSTSGMNQKGIYRCTRNPMYVAYFIIFLGCVLITQSIVLFAFVLVFQITAHWIILGEERWCADKFGSEYIRYMNKTRRYI